MRIRRRSAMTAATAVAVASPSAGALPHERKREESNEESDCDEKGKKLGTPWMAIGKLEARDEARSSPDLVSFWATEEEEDGKNRRRPSVQTSSNYSTVCELTAKTENKRQLLSFRDSWSTAKDIKDGGSGSAMRCKRNDGKQWQCSFMAEPGKEMCDHHIKQLAARSSKPRPPRNGRNTIPRSKTVITPASKDTNFGGACFFYDLSPHKNETSTVTEEQN